MTKEDLRELQRAWYEAVVFRVPTAVGLEPGDRLIPAPCWFAENVTDAGECEGRIEGAHWLKRQSVEAHVKYLASEVRMQEIGVYLGGPGISEKDVEAVEWMMAHLHKLAAWDPRSGVPACESHHRRFDGHHVDAANPFVVWRHEVPAAVEAFVRDWGLETMLEDRNPPIGSGA